MSLLERLKKTSKLTNTSILSESSIFNNKSFTPTSVPMINVALSGSIDGGLSAGVTTLAGPSKHFKTSFALLMASSYLKAHKDAALIFYDSEFGSPQDYFKSFDIDTERVLHVPIMNIEELKFDIIAQLEAATANDKIIIVIDSIGNLASKKEVEDAINEKSVADMTRAKAFKGLFRMITPYLRLKDIPLLTINHTYQTQEMFSKTIVSGGCVVKGTLITLADGTTKPVEQFIEGDLVATLDGPKPVTAVWNPDTLDEGEPECYQITFEDGTTITCSAAHKFIINDKWVEAKDIIAGMDCKKV